jgi:hypothetical protein
MKNTGDELNQLSMATEDPDEEDAFLNSMAEALSIAMPMIKMPKNNNIQRTVSELIPARNHLEPVDLLSILK